ncbi:MULTISPECIES: hypothetical protein [Flammeovirga]|uniref:Uncharacterized protein n=1 Tax=Flammeovirga aprica JL-4 TaxID=694437 RepID=A0A7X9P323_9BACT|nr:MULTISPECIES: hypothetical protein [Flammeovirga]KXX69929.1 hypothetical protein AVL50_13710 [Flammeovirga sp. SJP92]NME68515.1 hypothetical protein [Flammeovirga aprica JL-4]
MIRSIKSRYHFKRTEAKPKVNRELEGFDIKINSSGEIESSYTVDQLNEFLNKNVFDKKLKNTNE